MPGIQEVQWAPFNPRNSSLVSGVNLCCMWENTTRSTLFVILTAPKSASLCKFWFFPCGPSLSEICWGRKQKRIQNDFWLCRQIHHFPDTAPPRGTRPWRTRSIKDQQCPLCWLLSKRILDPRAGGTIGCVRIKQWTWTGKWWVLSYEIVRKVNVNWRSCSQRQWVLFRSIIRFLWNSIVWTVLSEVIWNVSILFVWYQEMMKCVVQPLP